MFNLSLFFLVLSGPSFIFFTSHALCDLGDRGLGVYGGVRVSVQFGTILSSLSLFLYIALRTGGAYGHVLAAITKRILSLLGPLATCITGFRFCTVMLFFLFSFFKRSSSIYYSLPVFLLTPQNLSQHADISSIPVSLVITQATALFSLSLYFQSPPTAPTQLTKEDAPRIFDRKEMRLEEGQRSQCRKGSNIYIALTFFFLFTVLFRVIMNSVHVQRA